jgi:hypothetical protein
MSTEPEACPFCGAAPCMETSGTYDGLYGCATADCPMSEAPPCELERWNRRVPDREYAARRIEEIADGSNEADHEDKLTSSARAWLREQARKEREG